ncbi:MAG: RNA methyltransferase [Gemmatimonadota bacterium]
MSKPTGPPTRTGRTGPNATARTTGPAAGEAILGRFVVVLHETRDIVNIALVVRAMKNMGLRRLRLVSPAEFDPYRVEGIAHDTEEIVAEAGIFDTLDEALADVAHVACTTARRRASRQAWSTPAEAARLLVRETGGGDVALVFGREDRGLPNSALDRCHRAICIPTAPSHASLNLSHAAILLFYEVRRAVEEEHGLVGRDLSPKRRDRSPPVTAADLEAFYPVWEEAMETVGLFGGVDAESKMRTFRHVFQRAGLDRRELRLLTAAAYEIVHYARRLSARLEGEAAEE